MAEVEYCTTAQVLALTGVTVTDTHCTNARYIIDAYVNENFQSNDGTTNVVTEEILNGSGTAWLRLTHSPILTVTKVEEDIGTFDVPNWVTTDWDADDYKTPTEHGGANDCLLTDGVWTKGKGNFRISYTYGYASVPSMVNHVACRIAAALKNDPDTIVSETIGSYSVTYGSDNTKNTIEELLKLLPASSLIIEGSTEKGV